MTKLQEQHSVCRCRSLKPDLGRNIVKNSVCMLIQWQTGVLEMSAPPCRNCACSRDGHRQRSEWDVACIIVKQTKIFHRQFAGRLTRGSKLWALKYECNFGVQYCPWAEKTRTGNSNHTGITSGILTTCDLLPILTYDLSFLCFSSEGSNRRYWLDVNWCTHNRRRGIPCSQSFHSWLILRLF